MYCLNEKQIDFILNDISARGIEMVGLQQDLLDHICCIIEHNLDEDGDFESFYKLTIKKFYKQDLKEIEEETINLLTHKNYYVMKKMMLASGGISTALLSLGILFKFMYWPGAMLFIFTGVFVLSFIFLPLSFLLKVKEKKETKDKIVIGLGIIAAISLSLGVLFKILHWPFANVLCIISLLIMVFLFLPIYFFSGIRNSETKVNTMVSSMLIVIGSALMLTLVRSPQGSRKQYIEATSAYLRDQQILENQQKISGLTKDSISSDFLKSGDEVYKLCSEIKAFLLKKETGLDKIDSDFEVKNALIGDSYTSEYLTKTQINQLKNSIEGYNSKVLASQKIPNVNSILGDDNQKVKESLNNLTQIQIIVLQNQKLN